jgi:hypothetical protein
MRRVPDRHGAGRIHRRERAHHNAVRADQRSAAEAAHHATARPLPCDGRTESGSGGAEREIGGGALHGLVSHVAIGRMQAPILVAAIEQIEQDRLRHDRHAGRADRETDALLAQETLHAGRGIEAEGRSAGKHQRIQLIDEAGIGEGLGFARAGTAAAQIGRCTGRCVRQDDGYAGSQPGVVCVADAKAGNVGDQI